MGVSAAAGGVVGVSAVRQFSSSARRVQQWFSSGCAAHGLRGRYGGLAHGSSSQLHAGAPGPRAGTERQQSAWDRRYTIIYHLHLWPLLSTHPEQSRLCEYRQGGRATCPVSLLSARLPCDHCCVPQCPSSWPSAVGRQPDNSTVAVFGVATATVTSCESFDAKDVFRGTARNC